MSSERKNVPSIFRMNTPVVSTHDVSGQISFDEYHLSAASARIFLKCIICCHRQAPFVWFLTTSTLTVRENGGNGLRLSSTDPAGSSIISFVFLHEFFDKSVLSSPLVNSPRVFCSRSIVKAFKNISPNKINGLQIRLSAASMDLRFQWKADMLSVRSILASDPPTEYSPMISSLLFVESQIRHKVISLTPRYLQSIVTLFPESSRLWELAFSISDRGPDDSAQSVYFTNSRADSLEPSLVVGFSVSQSELSRNGSFINQSRLPPGFQMAVSQADLKSILFLANDEMLRDSFRVAVGFAGTSDLVNERAVLTFHAGRQYDAVPKPMSSVSATLQCMNCICPVDTRDSDGLYDQHGRIQLDIENTSTHTAVLLPDDDDTLAQAAMMFDAPSFSSPFIVSSTNRSLACTQAQQSPQDDAATLNQPSEPVPVSFNEGRLPDWDEDIPQTPSVGSCRAALSNFDELWL